MKLATAQHQMLGRVSKAEQKKWRPNLVVIRRGKGDGPAQRGGWTGRRVNQFFLKSAALPTQEGVFSLNI
jgi:hypothetical protein